MIYSLHFFVCHIQDQANSVEFCFQLDFIRHENFVFAERKSFLFFSCPPWCLHDIKIIAIFLAAIRKSKVGCLFNLLCFMVHNKFYYQENEREKVESSSTCIETTKKLKSNFLFHEGKKSFLCELKADLCRKKGCKWMNERLPPGAL